MRNARVKLAVAAAVVGALTVGAAAIATGDHKLKETLTGYEEVPALSTPGTGEFRAFVNRSGDEIRYRLTYGDLESAATQSHIHFENATNNGAIVAFLCTNLGNAPAGTAARLPAGRRHRDRHARGPRTSAPGAAAQGIARGRVRRARRRDPAGATYVNVHTTDRPGGEIRAQLDLGGHH